MKVPVPLVLALCSASLHAQGWEVDPALVNLLLDGEVYADHECNNPAPPPNVPKAGPVPYDVLPLVLPPPHLVDVHQVQSLNVTAFPYSFFGFPIDFGAAISPTARDMCPQVEAVSTGTGEFFGDGLGSRSLAVFWETRVNNHAVDGDFFDRGCVRGAVAFRASVQNLPNTAQPWILRTDWLASGSADSSHECPDPACPPFGTPPMEDPGAARMDFGIEIDFGGRLPLVSSVLDPGAGLPPFLIAQDSFETTFALGTNGFDVDVDISSLAAHTLMFPMNEASTASFDATLFLHLINHGFIAPEPFNSYMRPIRGGGVGPGYSFRMGRYEITNQQYADFLNAAQLDGGATGIGSFVGFDADGRMLLHDGTLAFEPSNVAAGSRVVYTPTAPIGTRYTVAFPQGADPRSYEAHPVTNVTWFGAVKFCNWLTLERGLTLAARCYAEGPSADDWHPVTITTGDWMSRDLDAAERANLVRLRGFRLPMDDSGAAQGWLSNQPSTYNEWFKAAAYDPGAPATTRSGPGGELVPPLHHVFGVGRDLLGQPDANFFASTDPFDDDDAFVGLYDGTHYNAFANQGVGNGSSFPSAASDNRWGIYDLSGNIAEWGQDRVLGSEHALRGGSFRAPAAQTSTTYRAALQRSTAADDVGFRVVQAVAKRYFIVPPVQHP